MVLDPERRMRLFTLLAAFLPLAAAALAPAPPLVSPDGIEIAGADAGVVRAPSAPGAWGGPRTGAEPALSDRVASYRLRAVLDPVKHTIEGTEQLTWRNRSAVPVKSLYVHLYLNAFASPGSTFLTEAHELGGFRSGQFEIKKGEWGGIELRSVTQGGRPVATTFVHPDGGPEADHTVARLDLPEAVAPGATAIIDIAFHDQLPRVVARTGWFGTFHLAGQWFPKVGVLELPGERGATRPRWNAHELHLNSEFYADFGAYALEVVAPRGYTVAASGVQQGSPEDRPEGVLHRFRADDVHDVAFTAWNGFAPPLTARYSGPGSPEVSVQVLYPPEYERGARVALQTTLDALAYFSRTLGPYPYPAVTCVVPPFNAFEAGGMEYETFFTTIAGASFPLDQDSIVRYTTVHEFGHGYFMGLLASNEFEEPFLDEGMNELWDSRMLAGEPWKLRLPWLPRLLGLSFPDLDIWDFQRLAGTTRWPADPIAGSSWHRWSKGSYALVYPRTALVFHDLERRLGGDLFARGMRLYYARWHHRHPSAADLREALVDAGAERALIERYFEEQVYGASPVDDRVEVVASEEVVPLPGPATRDGRYVEREAKEVDREIADARAAWKKAHGEPKEGGPGPYPWRSTVKVRRYAAGVPQTLAISFEDGSVERLPFTSGERWQRFVLERPVKVASARLDEGRDVLLDLDKLDDGRTRQPHRRASVRLSLDAGAWIELLLAALEAL